METSTSVRVLCLRGKSDHEDKRSFQLCSMHELSPIEHHTLAHVSSNVTRGFRARGISWLTCFVQRLIRLRLHGQSLSQHAPSTKWQVRFEAQFWQEVRQLLNGMRHRLSPKRSNNATVPARPRRSFPQLRTILGVTALSSKDLSMARRCYVVLLPSFVAKTCLHSFLSTSPPDLPSRIGGIRC